MNTQEKTIIASLFNSITASKIMLRENSDQESRDMWRKLQSMASVALADKFGIELASLDLDRSEVDVNGDEYKIFLYGYTELDA
tara:strand:- start:1009 stop:1260 length:252 start_codon:yes stop_codon:yes gene_type:complete